MTADWQERETPRWGAAIGKSCGPRPCMDDNDTCVGYASQRRTPRHGNGGRENLWSGHASRRLNCFLLFCKNEIRIGACRRPKRIWSYCKISPNLGRIMGGVPMAGHTRAKPPKRERTIDGTTYIVTSHFKQTGSTAADHVRHLIDIATKERKTSAKR